jgi:hypothetical protein
MRFKLVHLLMVFPAYFLGMEIARLHVESFAPRGKWEVALLDVHDFERGGLALFRDPPASAAKRDEWMSNSANAQLDPWGHPYHCVERSESGQPNLGYYSCGEDGVSDCAGNDGDDLNSWDRHSEALYAQRAHREVRARCATTGLFYAAVLYFPLLLIAIAIQPAFRRAFRSKSKG